MEQLIEMTIGDFFDKQAETFPDVEAVVHPHEGIRHTYRGYRELLNRAARGFMAMGIEKGGHVAIWATNVPEWVITQFATAKIGAVLVTVNTAYKQFELEYLLRQSDSTTLILIDGYKDSDYVAHLSELCPEISGSEPGKLQSERFPCLKNVVYIGEKEKTPKGMYNFGDIFEMAESVGVKDLEVRQKSLHCEDVINMQYTSGTTGFPKGVMLTHKNLVNNGKCIGDCMKLTEKDRMLIHVPLFHCFGIVLSVMACMTHASTMVFQNYFHPTRSMWAISSEKCTAVNGVPTMFIAILDHEDFRKYDFSHLRTGIMAGSPCPTKVMRQVVDEMNMSEITIVFGQTESSPGMTQSRTDDPLEKRVATVGRLLPHCEGKIIDPETGLDLPPNVPGEIVTRGYHIMRGYYKMPEATAQAVDKDGWLHTGDIGMIDEEGYFKITGRLKDMIIRGGENIYPREIEEFMYTHPEILDVQVIGVPDRKYGEEVLAYVIRREGSSVGEEELIRFVKEGLSRYKAPRYVLFTDEFPMTASGKIKKYVLREMAVEALSLQAAASIETA